MIKGNQEFVMIDEQRVVYEEIIKLSTKCQKDHKKRTIICKGGPGTGKSVIAVQLLAELTQRDQLVQYVSKNSAPRQVYAAKLKGKVKKSSIDNMFKGSGMYTEAAKNMIHTLLVDEAHRLNEKSGMFHNMGENQIKEIIHASLVSVFFIDELNARLHPLLVRNFVLTFLNPEINPNHAQLVFTIHDTWQLSNQLLRRDEIWFVEKDERGVSTLYSLADFVYEDGSRIRKDESYQKNYLIGKYGAIPTLKSIDIFKEE
jgi:hypothetical protein